MKSNNCKQCPSVTNADLSNTEDEAFNMCRYDEKANQLPSLDWLHARFGPPRNKTMKPFGNHSFTQLEGASERDHNEFRDLQLQASDLV